MDIALSICVLLIVFAVVLWLARQYIGRAPDESSECLRAMRENQRALEEGGEPVTHFDVLQRKELARWNIRW